MLFRSDSLHRKHRFRINELQRIRVRTVGGIKQAHMYVLNYLECSYPGKITPFSWSSPGQLKLCSRFGSYSVNQVTQQPFPQVLQVTFICKRFEIQNIRSQIPKLHKGSRASRPAHRTPLTRATAGELRIKVKERGSFLSHAQRAEHWAPKLCSREGTCAQGSLTQEENKVSDAAPRRKGPGCSWDELVSQVQGAWGSRER